MRCLGEVDFAGLRTRLNAFLAEAVAVARRHFGGPVTYAAALLDFFDTQELLGAFVYTFISPDCPGSRIPSDDLDVAAFSVVRVIREHELDPASRYRWQPKQAFHAIARHNRGVNVSAQGG